MSAKKIQVRVVYFDKIETFFVHTFELVYALKELIKNKDQIAVENQMLVYLGLELDDTKTFGSYNIVSDSIITLQMSIALQKKHAHLLKTPNVKVNQVVSSTLPENQYAIGYYDNIPTATFNPNKSQYRNGWDEYETHHG